MKLLLLALGALLASASAHATTLYGLTSNNGLVKFDSAAPGSVTSIGAISQSGIVDIDFSPANGRLYGIDATGSLYFIDTTTGAATLAVAPTTPLANVADLDFNPAADRARVYGQVDQNYRIVPDASAITAPQVGTPGDVLVDGTWTNTGVDLVGSAYTNNFDGTATTTLYSIDTAGDFLIVHSVPPQFNTVTAVGTGLGVAVGSNVGFDIGIDGVAYVSNESSLYTADLAGGTLSLTGAIGVTGITSIAAVPEPGTMLLVAAGLAGLWGYGRRSA
jgi:hypothetical protein